MQYRDLKNNPPSQEELAKAESEKYVQEVGALYTLPDDEEPSIATVEDKEQLKDQPFFEKAENGDVTLIYTNAKLAILYRPSTKQLVNVSTVNIQSEVPIVKIIGSTTDRENTEKTLKDAFSEQINIVEGATAKNPSGEGITVVVLSEQLSEEAKKIAEQLEGEIGSLPAGEERPAGIDILVIVGS